MSEEFRKVLDVNVLLHVFLYLVEILCYSFIVSRQVIFIQRRCFEVRTLACQLAVLFIYRREWVLLAVYA